MTPFERIQPDVRENQIFRETLLAQPAEFFRIYLGTVPDLMEKAILVEKLIQLMAAPVCYANDVYRVRVRNVPPFVQLDINRHDGEPCNNWREFQRIKNELVGPECEAVELFPAESRLVDTANQYHLWVIPNESYRFPFGYNTRLVFDKPVVCRGADANEAPLADGWALSDGVAGLAELAGSHN
jgi:hypothetical protein